MQENEQILHGKDNNLISFTKLEHRPKHCNIVATLGPSSSTYEIQYDLIKAGLNIARLNFSHGTHQDHAKNIQQIRSISKELNVNVAILQDLQGPKIRTGSIINDVQIIEKNKKYTLSYGKTQLSADIIPIDYKNLIDDVAIEQRVLMDDGLLIFKITAIRDKDVIVQCLQGGELKSRKGVNFPDAKLSIPAMTEKDHTDLVFGVKSKVDYIALSFVQGPEDIQQIKDILKNLGSDIPVIAKIEKIPAIHNIDAIAKLADGLMVARGDLGVEGDLEKVPRYQRKIIEAARKFAHPVIIATQMLDSMITNPRPTLAEMTDVANGVLEGADCIMLSGEVASGKYPVNCVRQMRDIINEVENWNFNTIRPTQEKNETVGKSALETHKSIAISAFEAAENLNATAIVCLTLTGSIARYISYWRSRIPIIAITPREEVARRLSMIWGVQAILNKEFYNKDSIINDLPVILKDLTLVKKDDIIVITAGLPLNKMCSTNMIKVKRII